MYFIRLYEHKFIIDTTIIDTTNIAKNYKALLDIL